MPAPEDLVRDVDALLAKGNLLGLLGSDRDRQFDDLAELAASVCNSPIGLVSLIEGETVYFKGAAGLDIKHACLCDTFCAQTMQQEATLVVPNALHDGRFADSPYVTGEPRLRFYAGTPLYSPQGEKVGTLCVLDTIPRELKARESHALHLIARQVNAHMELAARRLQMSPAQGGMQVLGTLFLSLAEALPAPCYVKNSDGRLLFYNLAFARWLGVSRDAWLGKACAEIGDDLTAQMLAQAAESAFRLGRYVETNVESVSASGIQAQWRLCQSPCRGPDGESLLAAIAIEL